MSIDRRTDKQAMVHRYSGVVFRYKKKQTMNTHSKEESQNDYVKWKKLAQNKTKQNKKLHLYDSIYIKC